MKTVEIIGYKRANLGKKDARAIRKDAHVPCVLYGMGEKEVHFYVPLILFRKIVYTGEAHFVDLNIEGEECQCILQDVQFHPVSEVIIHADFFRINQKKKIKMNIPTRFRGQALGVTKGGTLVRKRPYLKVLGFPKDMPEYIDIDVSNLDFHHAIKVAEISRDNLEFLDPERASVAVIEIPRSVKTADAEETSEEESKDDKQEEDEKDSKGKK